MVEAEGNYVLLRRDAASDLLRESISAITEKLKPHGFVRIHRSVFAFLLSFALCRKCGTKLLHLDATFFSYSGKVRKLPLPYCANCGRAEDNCD